MSDLEVLMDFRETALSENDTKRFVKELEAAEDVASYDVVELPEGDFVINDEVCIERKQPSDLAQSMMKGRLESQVIRMYDEYEHVFILVSGNMQDLENLRYTDVSPKALKAFVGSLSARWGLTPMFCGDEERLIEMVIWIGRKSYQPLERNPGRPDVQTEDDLSPVGQVCLIVDGIGRETAKDIQEHFLTIGDLCNASPQDYKRVDGIGDKTAEKMGDIIK